MQDACSTLSYHVLQRVFLLLDGAWANHFGNSVFEALETKRLAGDKHGVRLLMTDALDLYLPQLADT
jgi:hypothetical protein